MAGAGDDRDAGSSCSQTREGRTPTPRAQAGAAEAVPALPAAPAVAGAVGRLRETADRVRDRLSRLPASGWRAAREEVRAAAQALADADADVEGEPRRGLPRLRGDAALADQLAVAADDLARAAAARGGDPADGGVAAPTPALPPAALLAAVEAGVREIERLESALRAR